MYLGNRILGGLSIPSFHYNRPGAACLLSTEHVQEELTALAREPPVVDLVEHTYRTTWGYPPSPGGASTVSVTCSRAASECTHSSMSPCSWSLRPQWG